MKLRRLQLKNFKKHEELTVDLEDGLLCLRGRSEAGKSTILHGIAYALFGAKHTGLSFENLVSYGKPAASLSVELDVEISGTTYHITRSKAGAEISYAGGLVTGQDVCTKFIEEQLGAAASLCFALFFANQNEIRGALGDGSKATTSLIEKLADFGQIDQLIEMIQAHLPTGPTKSTEERLAQAEKTLSEVGEPVPPPARDAELADLELRLRTKEAEKDAKGREGITHLNDVLAPLFKRRERVKKIEEALERAEERYKNLEAQRAAIAIPAYDENEHRGAIAMLVDYEAVEKKRVDFKRASAAYAGLPIVKSVWEGDGPSFVTFCEKNEAEILSAREWIASTQAEMASLNKQVLEGVCNVCGLDYDSVPSVGVKNQQVRAARDRLIEEINAMQVALKTKETERAAVKIINQQWQIVRDFIAKHGDYVSVDASIVPPKLTWTAAEPPATSYQQVKDDVARYDKLAKESAAAQGKYETLSRQMQECALEKLSLSGEAITESEGLEQLEVEDAKNKAMLAELTALDEERARLASALYELRTQIKHEQAIYTERAKTYELAKQQAAKAREDLEELNFSNALLKKVRSARPAVVDRIWQALLAAISHYFSQMRGTQSVVTRTDGTFLVDGRPVEGLSGSTLDILGLAIRVALLKTFLPNCSFLVLDEPAAACDAERETALIATIATAKFDQIVLVTHSDLADAFANQLVTL